MKTKSPKIAASTPTSSEPSDLLLALASDVTRCHQNVARAIRNGRKFPNGDIEAFTGFGSRQFVRSIFAYFEGATYLAKTYAVQTCAYLGIEVTDHELALAIEVDVGINDKGEVEQFPAKLRLANNIRYAFRLLDRANGGPVGFDPSADWWASFRRSIKVRDRLMHPRKHDDLEVDADEVIAAWQAFLGFEELITNAIEMIDAKAHPPVPTRRRKSSRQSR